MDDYTMQFLAELEREAVSSPNDTQVAPGQRPCPICGENMQVEVEQSVHIDCCPQHGIWLDRGELHSIINRVRSGERIDRHRLIRNARRDGKKSGALFGVWSLMFE